MTEEEEYMCVVRTEENENANVLYEISRKIIVKSVQEPRINRNSSFFKKLDNDVSWIWSWIMQAFYCPEQSLKSMKSSPEYI